MISPQCIGELEAWRRGNGLRLLVVRCWGMVASFPHVIFLKYLPPLPPSSPPSPSIKCVFFVTALCACKRSFPLHGTYFQVNEVFLDLRSAAAPVNVDINILKTSPKIVILLGASIGSVTRGMTRTEVTRLFNHQVLCIRAWERRTGYPRELPKWICPVVPVASTGQEFSEFDFPSPLLHPEKSAAAMASNNKTPKLG